jgi:hypothetical protein
MIDLTESKVGVAVVCAEEDHMVIDYQLGFPAKVFFVWQQDKQASRAI